MDDSETAIITSNSVNISVTNKSCPSEHRVEFFEAHDGCDIKISAKHGETLGKNLVTRSSLRRQAKQENNDNQTDQSNTSDKSDIPLKETRGKKRKNGLDDEGDSDHPDDKKHKSEIKAKPEDDEKCSCPRDVMKCIGILPSLPIVGSLKDIFESDESSGSESWFPLLPSISRSRKNNQEQ